MSKKSCIVVDSRPLIGAGFAAMFNVTVSIKQKQIEEAAKEKKNQFILMHAKFAGLDPFKLKSRLSKYEKPMFLYDDTITDAHLELSKKEDFAGVFLLSSATEIIQVGIESVLSGESLDYIDAPLQRRLTNSRGMKPTSRAAILSPREREVLIHLAEDYSVQDTAKILGIAPTTVETHRQSLRAKLDIRGAAGMAKFAIREGLISA